MKKSILPIVLCIAIGSTQVHAADRYPVNEGTPSKKSPAVVRNILSDKLPAKLLTTIKKSYKDYWITALYKEVSNGKTSYHITVENADQIITMSATHVTNWSVSRVIAKDQPES